MITFNTADLQKILNDYQKEVKKNLKKEIVEATKEVKKEVKKLSPVDSWTFIKWNRESTIIKSNKIIWQLKNKTSYWTYIEKSKTKKNYHKRKVKIYSWAWNETYTRALKNKEKEILKMIEKKI